MTQVESAYGADKSLKQPDRADACFSQQLPTPKMYGGPGQDRERVGL